MILYFSGVGNTRLVAERLASLCNDRAVALTPATPPLSDLCHKDEPLVLCFPVYAWGPPRFVDAYLKRSQRSGATPPTRPYRLYMVCTCGDDIGRTDRLLARMLRPLNLMLDGAWSVRMPNTYVALPGFDVDSKEVEQSKLRAAPDTLRPIADSIAAGEQGIVRVTPGALPWVKSHVLRPLFNCFLTGPGAFRLRADACTGCGRCAKGCPTGSIRMTATDSGPRPTWTAGCTLCLSCYHHCPQRAITYGRYSRNKGQYSAPQTL